MRSIVDPEHVDLAGTGIEAAEERGKVGEGSPRKGTKLVEVQLPTSTAPLCHANGPPPGELTANYIHVLSFAIKS